MSFLLVLWEHPGAWRALSQHHLRSGGVDFVVCRGERPVYGNFMYDGEMFVGGVSEEKEL